VCRDQLLVLLFYTCTCTCKARQNTDRANGCVLSVVHMQCTCPCTCNARQSTDLLDVGELEAPRLAQEELGDGREAKAVLQKDPHL
jgi:hypothetical protein